MKNLRQYIRQIILEADTCWDGYSPGAKTGKKTKISPKTGKRVNNCEEISEIDEVDGAEGTDEEEEKITEALIFHVSSQVGIDKNIYRPGSTKFFKVFREARSLYNLGLYAPKNSEELELLESLEIGEFAIYEGQLVPLDYPIQEGNEEHLNEAEYKGKKVDLNKPKRGGDGSYVYVNSGNKNKDGTIKVKKVSFGSSMPDAMGDSDAHKKRRKNYGDRHNCSDKDDKTKPGYWSCRATKFFGRDIAGWW